MPRAPSELGGELRTFARYLASTFTHPRAALVDLVHDRRGGAFAAVMLGTVAVLYSLVEWLLYREHVTPVPAPFLSIPAHSYYAWATLFCAPAIFGGWLLAGGAMQLVSRAVGGRGSFEELATALAWPTGTATWFALLPDLTTSALGVYEAFGKTAWGHVSQVLFLSLYVVAFGVLYASAVRAVHRVGWRSAIAVGPGGFALYQGFIFLFVR
jgi:Yip1-like protein